MYISEDPWENSFVRVLSEKLPDPHGGLDIKWNNPYTCTHSNEMKLNQQECWIYKEPKRKF